MNNKAKSVKKIVVGGIIILLIIPLIIPLYHYYFGIGYAKKEYIFKRLDGEIWFNGVGIKPKEENPFPLTLNLKKIPGQYAYMDFNGYQKEPNWYNYHFAWSKIYTTKEYKTLFLYDIIIEWPGGHEVFTYNEEYILPEYENFTINTSEEDIWNEDNTEKEHFLKIVGFFRNNLFTYRLDYLDIPPIKFNDIFDYKINEKFPCEITVKYSLDNEDALIESYDLIVKVEKGWWWNPNAWWWNYL
jgi:hypothetical protein